MTHAKKKNAKYEAFNKTDNTKPAAKKPLYRPWLAANTFVSSANALDFNPKLLMPLGVVQKNISKTRK